MYNGSEVNIIRVTNGQLIKDSILKFKHYCCGIAHHQGKLYVTDSTALYHYTVDGRLVSKMYEDASGRNTGNNYGYHYSKDLCFNYH
ncbi:hypothetical protein DPMN_091295 [Dreissena polymorpha]|uniref:Uncharacterized protein n=1 Tax=Dreissena polymorpha TaxID=45954 RepID=A0A9D4QZ02_DREPO|nr:hypothetical protein DPMN_091295 [Dreissena polymorpha]